MKQQVLKEWSCWAELGVKAEPSRALPQGHSSLNQSCFKTNPSVHQLLSLSQEGHKCWCFTAEKDFCTMQSLTGHTLLIPALIWVPCKVQTPCQTALPLPLQIHYHYPLPKCSLPLPAIRGILFFMAPACWHLLPHSRFPFIQHISIFFNCKLCFCYCQAAFPASLVSMPGVNGQGRWKASSSTQLLFLKRLHDLCL